MDNVNEMIFDIDNYGKNRDKMFEDIKKFISSLTINNYICVIREEELGVVVVRYLETNSDRFLVWLTEEQYYKLFDKEKNNG